VNTQSSLAEQLREKEYRDAYVASQIRIGLPMQCRALRESREWTQPQLAEAAGMSQPRISEIERPGERKLNLETLLRLASAFDVGLQVRFVPFSRLVDDDDSIHFDSFYVSPFAEDITHLGRIEQEEKLSSRLVNIEAFKQLSNSGLNDRGGIGEQLYGSYRSSKGPLPSDDRSGCDESRRENSVSRFASALG
jgi:transcriptional regulator with XRE-family HTH domain